MIFKIINTNYYSILYIDVVFIFKRKGKKQQFLSLIIRKNLKIFT